MTVMNRNDKKRGQAKRGAKNDSPDIVTAFSHKS